MFKEILQKEFSKKYHNVRYFNLIDRFFKNKKEFGEILWWDLYKEIIFLLKNKKEFKDFYKLVLDSDNNDEKKGKS